MPDAYASAIPHKRFFLEMFTRDISLQDCILDLIDNSIDGFIRSNNVNLDIAELLAWNETTRKTNTPSSPVTVEYNGDFAIEDKSGGIARKQAEDEVFNFGHSEEGLRGTKRMRLRRVRYWTKARNLQDRKWS